MKVFIKKIGANENIQDFKNNIYLVHSISPGKPMILANESEEGSGIISAPVGDISIIDTSIYISTTNNNYHLEVI